MIKVVLLDVDNTLMDFHACARQSMEFTARELGVCWPDNMFELFTPINNELWHQVEKEQLTVDELHKIRWNKIFDAAGIDFDGWVFEQHFLQNIAKGSATVEGARELVEYLAPKYTLCVASNAPYYQQVSRMTNADLLRYFDHLFISERIGHAKPKKEFFDACLAQLPGIKKEEIVMIGDSISADIVGAHNYGLETVWFNFGNEPEEKGAMADHIVYSLSQIHQLL